MYVVTFYSFRGGVGRTMALVNVGVELAKTGRRVLLVDFDLEAPGLDTFNLPQPKESSPGLVDYVTRYTATGEAPDVSDYIFECPGIGSAPPPSFLTDRQFLPHARFPIETETQRSPPARTQRRGLSRYQRFCAIHEARA